MVARPPAPGECAMKNEPPLQLPGVLPYLHYEDVAGALEFLSKAFGFAVHLSMPGSDGAIVHAEMTLGRGVVMLGPESPESGARSPRQLGGVTQSLYVYVDDVDGHFRHAREAGVTIVREPADMFWGDRVYSARDPEGHHWTFASPRPEAPAP